MKYLSRYRTIIGIVHPFEVWNVSKMAPGGVLECHRYVYRLFILCFLVLLCFLNHTDCLRLMYDQTTLLKLRQTVLDTNTCDPHIKLFTEQRRIPHSPFKLCGSSGCACWFSRRRRKRGTRAGIMVKLKKLRSVCRGGRVVKIWHSFSVPVVPLCIPATFVSDYVDETVGEQRGGLHKFAPLGTGRSC